MGLAWVVMEVGCRNSADTEAEAGSTHRVESNLNRLTVAAELAVTAGVGGMFDQQTAFVDRCSVAAVAVFETEDVAGCGT